MCGIAGVAALDGFDPKVLVSMTHLIKHRGPDGFGFVYFDLEKNSRGECIHNEDRHPVLEKPSLGLGHRRLSILDLSALGSQPMQIDDGLFWITYNGEVYNYLEIREELERAGHSFRTRTDTEVILHAYKEWGPSCVNCFNGMWSFAIWDRTQRSLFCSRDRFGVKPFYYYLGSTFMVFGSEIKQILQFPAVTRAVNDSVVFQYLEQGLLDHSAETFFAGIRQLPSGHSLTLDLSPGTLNLEIQRYWELPLNGNLKISEGEAIEEFSARLKRAVTWRMRSDVPVGSCLSGGLDSSSIVSLATKVAPGQEFHTFSSCFEEEAIDERKFIFEVVSSVQATPHFVFPTAEGLWSDLESLIWHQDEPVGGTSIYAQWCVMRAARQARIPVLLDGQGGDEILCGYRKFFYFHLWHLLKRADPSFIAEGLAWVRNAGGPLWSWNDTKRYIPVFKRRNVWLTTRVCQPDFLRDWQGVRYANLGPGVELKQRQKDDLAHFSIPALLHYEDRNSMAHSVEARVPFLDYELAEFAVNCPPSLKLRNGWTKWILRQAFRGTLPEPVRLRKSKLGFPTPQRKWLQQDLSRKIKTLVGESDLRMNRVLLLPKVREEFDSFLAAQPGSVTDSEVFRVLNLELWARVFHVS